MDKQKEEDLRHTNEYGEIEIAKDTGYWFKRDLKTIKSSFIKTIQALPFVVIVVLAISLLISKTGSQWEFKQAFVLTLLLSPIALLGYWMIYALVVKGYDIDPYAGTHIDNPNYSNRFSVKKILSSQAPTSRKILFLLRLAFYILMCIGLLMAVFSK